MPVVCVFWGAHGICCIRRVIDGHSNDQQDTATDMETTRLLVLQLLFLNNMTRPEQGPDVPLTKKPITTIISGTATLSPTRYIQLTF